MSDITTTLNKIRKHSPCTSGWEKLLKSLGKTSADDEPLKFSAILASNGIDDTLWCLRSICPEHEKEVRLFAADCADMVLPIFEKQRPNDDRPRLAIKAVRDFANGEIDEAAMAAARAAAREAAREGAMAAARAAAREAARAAAMAAARAAAREAARAAAMAAARAAAREGAWEAARAASGEAAMAAAWAAAGEAAREGAMAAAGEAARAAAGEAQGKMLIERFS